MKYVIRSKFDKRSLLALPERPGLAVRWVDPCENIEPWTFDSQESAERARAMSVDCGEVVPHG